MALVVDFVGETLAALFIFEIPVSGDEKGIVGMAGDLDLQF